MLHPSADLSRLRHARASIPLEQPGRRRDHGLGMGRLPRSGGARAGRRRQVSLVVAHGAEYPAGDGQGDRQLRQLGADQDGGARRRLRRGHRARRVRQRQRRVGPEHLHRAQRHHLHPADRRVDARWHHPRHDHHAGARLALHGRSRPTCRESSSTWPTRSSSSAPPPKSPRFGRSTRSPSARAGAVRSPRRCSAPSSTSSTAWFRTPTAGSPGSTRGSAALRQPLQTPPPRADKDLRGRGFSVGGPRRERCAPRIRYRSDARASRLQARCEIHARQRSAQNCRRPHRLRPPSEGRQLPDDARQRHADSSDRRTPARPRRRRRDERGGHVHLPAAEVQGRARKSISRTASPALAASAATSSSSAAPSASCSASSR